MRVNVRALTWFGLLFMSSLSVVWAQEGATPAAPDTRPESHETKPPVKRKLSPDPPGMVRLQPNADIWIDRAKNRLVIDGNVCLIRGPLEMFACLKGTKEHESIVAVDCEAMTVHAGLLALGAKPGTPVVFRPEYKPATGSIVDITCIWTDDQGKVHRDRAQDWIREHETEKPMTQNWVFAGSGFWKDEDTGKDRYLAEGGDFICVSNFPSAMLDVPINSSSEAEKGLLFEAWTDKIPPKGTRVRLVLTPRLETKPAAAEAE